MNHSIFAATATMFLMACLTRCCVCLDPKFAACQSRSCTSDGVKVIYPFFIKGVQPSYCGAPGYEINCSNNGEILFNGISSNTYRVSKIDYVRQHFRVVNVGFVILFDTCSAQRPI
uniref:Wall-associated receptor kinase galacturonan-binding domain-containing protein n=1 Tax=Kalanchoe fedtschenkoi TaxID=63787 RepID=A0A7N0UTZ9_KALFE